MAVTKHDMSVIVADNKWPIIIYMYVPFYNVESVRIEVEEMSGILTIEGTLNREVIDQYNLTVTARDNTSRPLSSTARIIINVIDVNDNPPKFVGAPYNSSLDKGALPGTKVGYIHFKVMKYKFSDVRIHIIHV